MKKKRFDVIDKVRTLRCTLGNKETVRAMRSASVSSLRRWANRKCRPIRAHVRLVNETYEIAKRMGMLKVQQKQKKSKKR